MAKQFCKMQCDPSTALDINLLINLYGMFSGLPKKYQNAFDVCLESAYAIIEFPENVWPECMFCYNAIAAVANSKTNYYGGLLLCSRLK